MWWCPYLAVRGVRLFGQLLHAALNAGGVDARCVHGLQSVKLVQCINGASINRLDVDDVAGRLHHRISLVELDWMRKIRKMAITHATTNRAW